MQNHESPKSYRNEQKTAGKLLTLLTLGLSTTILGLILIAASEQTSFGGVIFIGPFPIAFGAGPGAQWLILFAIILTALSLIIHQALRRKTATA
jgi:uncharacterized membrane protein